ncbi:cryptochrome-1-like [Argonauta hians]
MLMDNFESNCESSSEVKPKISVHWFRHGQRLHDNPALVDALKDCKEFYPVFIFDDEVAGTKLCGFNRWRFLLENLKDLDESFAQYGGRLYVFHGKPVEVFESLQKEWGITHITAEADPESIWKERDNKVTEFCQKAGIQCSFFTSHTLWDPKNLLKKNGGTPPLTFELFQLVTSSLGPPPRPLDVPSFEGINMPLSESHDKFSVPTLDSLGIYPEFEEQKHPINVFIGGEKRALVLLKARLEKEAESFRQGNFLPNHQEQPELLARAVSLSPYLRFGCVSIRKTYWDICDTYKKIKKAEPPTEIVCQLYWREYFYIMSIGNINFDKIENNPICLKINWADNEEHLKKWEMGKTGFPWIDAIMNQLRFEGWNHHVGRHAVSCFLTRGDLWVSWEEGLKIFLKYQLDADWSVCAGNWMWVSSSAFEKALQCPTCYSPIMYGMRMDKNGDFVRTYVPVLKDMPLKYLFCPWKAPLDVQEAANCIVGKDYPFPIVNHRDVSKQNMAKMYKVKEHLLHQDVPHCGPTNETEVWKFAWLPPIDHHDLAHNI